MNEIPKEYRIVTSPYYNEKVFDYWGGCYEAVYILFKPFYQFKPDSKWNRNRLFNASNCWEIWPDIIEAETYPVNWKQVKEGAGFADYKELAEALTIKFDKTEGSIKLNKYVESHEILYPDEDNFVNFLVDDILHSFRFLGYEELLIGPEFPDDNMPFNKILRYKTDTDPSDLLYSKNIYAPDNKILFTTAFDYHHGFICSDRETIEKLIDKFQFEGFFCSQDTTTWWFRN